MTSKLLIGGLTTAVAVLTVALAVVAMDGRDHMWNRDDGYHGMMQAMGDMDSDRMLGMMRSVLGEEGYQVMQQHMAEHRRGLPSTYDKTPAGMMHQMMDGMIQRMPDDRSNSMPMMRP